MTEPSEDEVNSGDLDLDWDSHPKTDRGPERPANPPSLITPTGGPPASPGDLTSDPDEPTTDAPGDYLV